MRVLLVSHQLDYSGAPIALLELGKALLRLEHDVAYVALAPGPLSRGFKNEGIAQFDPTRERASRFDLIIANTVVTVPLGLKLAGATAKVLAWVHESRYFFDVLKANPRQFALDQLRFAAFPARFQLSEFDELLPGAIKFHLPNHVGAIDGESEAAEPYFVCTGHWEARKSQERLVRLLDHEPGPVKVRFLGAERPSSIASARYVFTGALAPANARKEIARSRGLISCSRAEVQPLSVIEAMMARLPVLLSDIDAHRELKEIAPGILLFDPDDASDFRRAFEQLQAQWLDHGLRTRLKEQAQLHFGRASFDRRLAEILEQICGAPAQP